MKLAKDVIILGIQQYRIPALVPSCFFTSLCRNSQKIKKCDTGVRKLDFLCPGRAGMALDSYGVGNCEFLCGAVCGETDAEEKEKEMVREAEEKVQMAACRSDYWKYRRFVAV